MCNRELRGDWEALDVHAALPSGPDPMAVDASTATGPRRRMRWAAGSVTMPGMVVRFFAVLVGVVLIGAGLVAVIVGGAGGPDTSYVADFGRPGEDCGSGRVHFDAYDGKVLRCAPGGGASVSFPGFTEAQNEEIEALAEELGVDILSEADEVQIQHRIDEIAATVPESARPQPEGFGPLRGAGLAWAGGALIAVGLLGVVLVSRRS